MTTLETARRKQQEDIARLSRSVPRADDPELAEHALWNDELAEDAGQGDDCTRCGHPFDPHILAATGDPLDGGLIFCQVPECDCAGTWSVEGRPEPEMPPAAEVARIRAALMEAVT